MKTTTLLALTLGTALLASCGPTGGQSAQRTALAATEPVADTRADTPTPRQPRAHEEQIEHLRVLHVYGTPQEMGTQLGEIAGDSIRYLMNEYLQKIPGAREREAEAIARAAEYAAHMPDTQLAELRAMATAANVRYEHLLVGQCIIELYEETLCASVAAWGDATPDGNTIVGRNLDWYDDGKLHKHSVVVVRHPNTGRAFVSVGYPGMSGVVTGMNEDGLFVADLVQMVLAREKRPLVQVGMPVMALQRVVLEQAATVDEAVAIIERATRTVPHNYIVADASRAEFLETDSETCNKRPPTNNTVIGTNYAGEKRDRAQLDFRFAVLCQCVDRVRGEVGTEQVEEALGRANLGKLSVQSVVAFPAARKLRVSMGTVPACKGPFVDVDAGALMEVSQ